MVNQLITLKKYFTQEAIARTLLALPVIHTPIMDLFFPPERRKQKMSAYLGLAEIEADTGIVPVIKRGSRSYPVDGDTTKIDLIEPMPITPSIFVKAKDINDLISSGVADNVQAFVQEQIERLRNICRQTTEVLCARALSGSIAYKMGTESGTLKEYAVSLGTIKLMSAIDITGKSLAQVQGYLEKMYVEMRNKGYAGDIRFLFSDSPYSMLVTLVLAANNAPVQWTDYGLVLFGKYKIMPMGLSYTLPGAVSATSVLEDKYVQAIDISAPHGLYYCALDDLDANLAPMPYFAKPVASEDPSGYKIIGNSKPFPAPVIRAMVKQKWVA